MSFLAGRLAGKEGAYFFQESKQAVSRLKKPPSPTQPSSSPAAEHESQGDVLPEVLRHSLPSKLFHETSNSSPSAIYCRWQLPQAKNSISASTANDLRKDRDPPVNAENLKAAAEGLAQIGKAFAVATALVFGGATLIFGMAVSKLELQSSDDIRTKGRDLIEPKLEVFKKQLLPLRDWLTPAATNLTHNDFKELFYNKYFTEEVKKSKVPEFVGLAQGTMTVDDYVIKFEGLLRFVPWIIGNDIEKMNFFIKGLKATIHKDVSMSRPQSFSEAVELAMISEKGIKRRELENKATYAAKNS
ncbi:hypothetical protein L484_004077 [Morus notabilis]|uniref:Ty3 transposon capsid-like protein domain-containing protein n=1 Tax=Morus notabilis TaxID=981085 RepID=W9QQJ4_9ROSA|nr:hypothetical protein L484_004077 [Morus notabilis]